jgi:hypothetical protein
MPFFLTEFIERGDKKDGLATEDIFNAYLEFCYLQHWKPAPESTFFPKLPDLMGKLFASPKSHHIKRAGLLKEVRGFARVRWKIPPPGSGGSSGSGDGNNGDGGGPEGGRTNTMVVDEEGLPKGATFLMPPTTQPEMLTLGLEYVIDFENYHDAENNVKLLGGPNYFRANPPYLLGVAGSDGFRCVGAPELFDWAQIPLEARIWAHNAAFDTCYFEVNPNIPKRRVYDSAALAAYIQSGRSLKDASETILQKPLDKAVRKKMAGVRYADLPAADQEEVKQYCLKDAETALEIVRLCAEHWPADEALVALLASEMAVHGVLVDPGKITEGMVKMVQVLEDSRALIPWTSKNNPEDDRGSCMRWIKEQGVTPPTTVNRSKTEYLGWIEQQPQFKEAMQAKFDALSANKILTRLESVKRHTNSNGRCSYEISYYGAVTGRFAASNKEDSGKGSVNMQNFNRDPFHGFAVREIICAGEGKKLLVYDFSQVEAVVLARVSGNGNHLDAVRRKESLYEAEAVGAGVWEKGQPGFKQWTDYVIYKQRVLALGYGLGALMFQRRMKAQGKNLSWKEAEKAVHEYREQNFMVPKIWEIYNYALKEAVQEEDGELAIYLPSGRVLRYFYFSEEDGEIHASQCYTVKRTKKGEAYTRPKWYGAKLVENICQAIARDLLVGGILRVTAAGYRIVAHTHDEIIVEVMDADVERAMEDIPPLMEASPMWDPGLPVGVSRAEPIEHYRK